MKYLNSGFREMGVSGITFDTHQFIKSLKTAGFEENQAEALAEALKNVQQLSVENLATKSDVKELEMKLSAEINLLKWMLGFVLAGILSLIAKAFFSH